MKGADGRIDGPRLALLIAQQAYRPESGLTPLETPAACVIDLGSELETFGFDVTLVGEGRGRRPPMGIADLRLAIEQFAEKVDAHPGAVVFFYFAGHGVAIGDGFYLLAETAPQAYPRAGALELSEVAERLNNGRVFLMMVADACRFHADPAHSRRIENLLDDSAGRFDWGLIATSASDGQSALDRDGELHLSPFTNELIRAMQEPQSIMLVFQRTREMVAARKPNRQTPSFRPLNGVADFYLHRNLDGLSPTRADQIAAPPPLVSPRSAAWLEHRGPLALVLPPSKQVEHGRPAPIVLSTTRDGVGALNPLGLLEWLPDRKGDIARTYAELLLAGTPASGSMGEEKEARQLLEAFLLVLGRFRDPALRDMSRLQAVWDHLREAASRRRRGTIFEDPLEAFTMMADWLERTEKATTAPEYTTIRVLAATVTSQEDANRKLRTTATALAPLRELQMAQSAAHPLDLERILSRRDAVLVIEHDPETGSRKTLSLWLAMIHILASVRPFAGPLMIAMPDPAAIGRLPYLTSAAMLVAP